MARCSAVVGNLDAASELHRAGVRHANGTCPKNAPRAVLGAYPGAGAAGVASPPSTRSARLCVARDTQTWVGGCSGSLQQLAALARRYIPSMRVD